jgi:hypothetical protein
MKLLPELSWSASVSAKVVNAFVCRSFLPPLHWCLFLVPYLSQCPETAMLCCKSLIRNITQTDIKHKKTKQNITSPCITSDHITSHYITLRYTTLHYTKPHYTTLHYITLHCTTLHYITLMFCTTLHNITQPYIASHYMTLHDGTLHYIPVYIYNSLTNKHPHTKHIHTSSAPYLSPNKATFARSEIWQWDTSSSFCRSSASLLINSAALPKKRVTHCDASR